MRAITKSDYQRCFHEWQECWNKCIQAQGHYFEGDDQLAVKSTLSLTKKSVLELNDQSLYITYCLKLYSFHGIYVDNSSVQAYA